MPRCNFRPYCNKAGLQLRDADTDLTNRSRLDRFSACPSSILQALWCPTRRAKAFLAFEVTWRLPQRLVI